MTATSGTPAGAPATDGGGRGEWIAAGALTAAAIGLGMAGFHAVPRYQSHGLADLFYLALQLFPLQSGYVEPPVPAALQVARLLAPGLAGYAAARAFALIFRDQIARLRARRARNHVVVAGAGRRGARLAAEFRRRGERVVVIDRDPAAPGLRRCRAAGAIVVAGDATSPADLAGAGAGRARTIVAACGGEGTNAEVAVAARAVTGDAGGPDATCFAHVADPYLSRLLDEAELRAPAGGRLRIEFVNVYERGARALLGLHPIAGARGRPGEPHLIVAGLGRLGEAIVVQAARACWFDPGGARRLTVTVLDREAAARVEAMAGRHPGLGDACRLGAANVDVRTGGFDAAARLPAAGGSPEPTLACVCFGDETLGVTAALKIERGTRGLDVPVVVRVAEPAGLASLVEAGRVRAFPLIDATCRPEVLLSGITETLAVALHEDHVDRQHAAGMTAASSDALEPWARLGEEYRESSRRRARELAEAFREAGYELRLDTAFRRDAPGLPDADVERLARREHERWRAEREGQGWRHAPGPRDSARRTSPLLVAWEALDEVTREQNRESIRALPRFLARTGFELAARGAPTARA